VLRQFQALFEELQKLAPKLVQNDRFSGFDIDGYLTPLQQHILRELILGYPSQHPPLMDELTGLLMRSSLIDRLNQALMNPMRVDSIMAVCFIDFDGFKEINDQHGHSIGDQALRLVGERLQKSIRSGDLLGRWGGDEFVLVLQNIDCQESIKHLADRLLGIISHPLKLSSDEPLTLFLGASIGVAIASAGVLGQKVDALALIERADLAMYEAKRSGKNRFEIAA
jgi:diguanylate cyclase (GGDEF)-like protein